MVKTAMVDISSCFQCTRHVLRHVLKKGRPADQRLEAETGAWHLKSRATALRFARKHAELRGKVLQVKRQHVEKVW